MAEIKAHDGKSELARAHKSKCSAASLEANSHAANRAERAKPGSPAKRAAVSGAIAGAIVCGVPICASAESQLMTNEPVPLLVSAAPFKKLTTINLDDPGFRIFYVNDPDWAVPYKQVKDAVVSVDVEYQSRDGKHKCKASHGSGSLLSADGLIVTATHVIADAPRLPAYLGEKPLKKITITDSKQNTYAVEDVGGEHPVDLSFVHVVGNAKGNKFSFVKLAESSDIARQKNGFVVGYPLTFGIPFISGGQYNGLVKLSAINYNRLPNENTERNLQQWSSKGLSGESGGLHFVQTADGPRLVGVQSRSYPEIGNFATPVEDVRRGLSKMAGIKKNADGTFAFDLIQNRRGQKKAS